MTKTLISDIDDSFLIWNSQFFYFLEDEGVATLDTQGNIQRINYEMSRDDWEQLYIDFQYTDYFGYLDIWDCAKEILPRFKDNGWKIVAVSAAVNEPKILETRIANLNRHIPDVFDEVYHTSGSENKEAKLKMFPKSIWVEDSVQNALTGNKLGHRTFLLADKPKKIKFPKTITFVNDWYDIWDKVNETVI